MPRLEAGGYCASPTNCHWGQLQCYVPLEAYDVTKCPCRYQLVLLCSYCYFYFYYSMYCFMFLGKLTVKVTIWSKLTTILLCVVLFSWIKMYDKSSIKYNDNDEWVSSCVGPVQGLLAPNRHVASAALSVVYTANVMAQMNDTRALLIQTCSRNWLAIRNKAILDTLLRSGIDFSIANVNERSFRLFLNCVSHPL